MSRLKIALFQNICPQAQTAGLGKGGHFCLCLFRICSQGHVTWLQRVCCSEWLSEYLLSCVTGPAPMRRLPPNVGPLEMTSSPTGKEAFYICPRIPSRVLEKLWNSRKSPLLGSFAYDKGLCRATSWAAIAYMAKNLVWCIEEEENYKKCWVRLKKSTWCTQCWKKK